MKKIVLTGGGTAGHVTPNIALIPRLQEMGYEVHYMGTHKGMERELIEAVGIPYHPISSGKLRRYFDLKNFTDPFKVLKGYGDSYRILKKIKPDVVFSKGGFVAAPVVAAAHQLKIPAILHESDMTPGLANKLCQRFATKFCCNFPETLNHLPKDKAVHTGTPIRQELKKGSKEEGLTFTGLNTDKPIILIMGGSLGAVKVNDAIRTVLKELLEDFQIIHLCGKDKVSEAHKNIKGYVQFEFISEELPDLLACTDLVVSRAGANAISEFLALRIPNVLIPLSMEASRGDQILNAKSFAKQGFSAMIEEEDITPKALLELIRHTYEDRAEYIKNMESSKMADPIETITGIINELAEK